MKVNFLKISVIYCSFSLISCGGGTNEEATSAEENISTEEVQEENTTEENVVSDDPMQNKGIGPVEEVFLPDEIDQTLADKGAEIFKIKCSSCHKPNKKFVGPSPKGILERRTPEWVMNMILNPEEMVKKDPIAKKLLEEFLSPMANQNLTEEDARAVLEYFRTL